MNQFLKRAFSMVLALVLCLSLVPVTAQMASAEEITATLSFADTANRTSFSTSQQVWEQNGITFTNDKASSSTNVANYSNPVRLYGKSSATIAYTGGIITKIEVTCSSSSYATVFKNSAGDEATVSGSVVTIVPTAEADSYTIASFTAQTRVSSITVYAATDSSGEETCQHSTTTTSTVDATCTEAGSTTEACADCGEVLSETEIPAAGHTDDDGDDVCDVCKKSTLQWTLVTDASVLKAGDQVIIAAVDYDYALSTTQNTNNRAQAAITKSDNVVTFGEDTQVLTLEGGTAAGTFAFYTGEGYLYAASSSSNYLKTETTLSDDSSWAITITDGVASVVAQGSNTRNTMQYNNSSSLFSCYSSASQKAICLYYLPGEGCAHSNTEQIAAVEATCEEAGYTAGVYCSDCETYLSGRELIEALGHNYGEGVVVAPTYEDKGYTAYTCDRCSDVKKDSYTDALKNVHTVNFAVPEGVAEVASMTGDSSGIILPAAGALEGYTFVGWTAAAVEDTQTAPEIYFEGATFVPAAETTLYALYSFVEGGSGTTEYVLTDIASIKATDTVVITMEKDGTVYALSNANGSSKAPPAQTVTVIDGKLTEEPANELKWNIAAADGGYIIYCAGTTDTWLYCTSSNNGVRVGTNSANVFSIDSASGYLKHNGTSRYLGVYLTTPDWRCYTNTTGNTAGQTLGFYVLSTGGGTTYYTTMDAVAPAAPFTRCDAQGNVTSYTTFEAAMRGYDPLTQYIKLNGNVTLDVELSSNLYLDLAGYSWNGTITTGSYILYGMDSTTDDYDCSDGNGTVKVTGNVEVHHKTAVTGKVRRYLTYTETDGTLSFHRIYLGITSMSLRPAAVGVGYKATFRADSKALSMLDENEAFGYRLWILDAENNEVGAATRYLEKSEFTNKGTVTLRLQNFNVETYGEHQVCAEVYMKLSNGTVIDSADYSYTLRSLLETIAKDISGYSETQMKSIQAMCLKYKSFLTEKEWAVSSILDWTATA